MTDSRRTQPSIIPDAGGLTMHHRILVPTASVPEQVS